MCPLKHFLRPAGILGRDRGRILRRIRSVVTRVLCIALAASLVLAVPFSSVSVAENLGSGIVLADDRGNVLLGQNREKKFIPASILKILTSLAALHLLGEDYRFQTVFHIEPASKNLFVKGFGDPLLISEVVEELCRKVAEKTDAVHDIILDHHYFSSKIQVPGKQFSLNPYDAPIGALCVNFNTIQFKWSDRENRFVSGEPQTPLLDIFQDDIEKTGLKHGRIILSSRQSRLYPGWLIQSFLEKNRVKIGGKVIEGRLDDPTGDKEMFRSPFVLTDVVQKLLKYSNNFMANQLLLTVGAAAYQPPATLEKGVEAIRQFAAQTLNLTPLALSEGSGLSRANRMSPDQMIKILIEFMPYHALLNRQGNEYYKTGTLFGVRTRAGYILGEDNRLYPYVIMVNQKNRGYQSIRKKLLDRVFKMTANRN